MTMQYRHRLPTVEEAQEFLRLINVGRKAAGMDELEYLDFDGADPGASHNCLSARNLFLEAGWMVWSNTVTGASFGSETRNYNVIDALGMHAANMRLPDAILRVTDPFDAIAEADADTPVNDEGIREEWRDALRDRLVEAGVVEP